MKNKLKVMISIILILASICMVACGQMENIDMSSPIASNKNTTSNNDENVVSEEDALKAEFPILEELSGLKEYMNFDNIKLAKEKKNKDYTMPLSNEPMSDEEFASNILLTQVTLQVSYFDNDKGLCGRFSGNIYDIDENYMYILTCRHGFDTLGRDINKIRVSFYDMTEIEVPVENYYIGDDYFDLALLAINIKDIPTSILESVKTINIDNFGKLCVKEDDVLYNISYDKPNNTHILTYSTQFNPHNTKTGYEFVTTTIQPGVSGAGFFDEYGNYYGYVINEVNIRFACTIDDFYEYIIAFNPNY